MARNGVRRLFFLVFSLVGLIRRLHGTREPAVEDVRSILVVRMDLLGDVVFSMPAVEALKRRYPEARLTMLTLPYTSELAQRFRGVDQVIAVDTNRIRSVRGLFDPGTWRDYWRTWRGLRRSRFDLAVSVYGRMGSLCAFLSGARRTVGYRDEAYPFLLTDPVPGGRHRERMHEVEYARRLAEHAGADHTPFGPALRATDDDRSRAARLLGQRGIAEGERFIVINAGAINGEAKRWPAAYWARFSDELQTRHGVRVVLVGAAGDAEVAREVMTATRRPVVSLVGSTTIGDVIGVLDLADLVASGDSGPLHLAAALGRRVVAVYGPTDPRIYGPYGAENSTVVLRHDLPCSPCYTLARTAQCPLGDPICMRLVTVDRMVEAAERVLST